MTFMRVSRRQAVGFLGVAALMQPKFTLAQTGPDPVTLIGAFYDTLLECMKRGTELGFEGRYQLIEPVLNETFDIATMCKIAVGPEWTKMPGDKKGAVVINYLRVKETKKGFVPNISNGHQQK